MTANTDVITHTLELCAELAGDITEDVFRRFFDLCPDALDVMGHSDEHMRGRMVEAIVTMLLAGPVADDDAYLRWEVDNHIRAYSVYAEMYAPLMQAMRDAVEAALADAWTAEMNNAWNTEVAAILHVVDREVTALDE